MRFIVMFVTAVCVLFLIKLRWPKKKNFYDAVKHFGIFELLQCIVVVEQLPHHFNGFQLEPLTGLTLVIYECV